MPKSRTHSARVCEVADLYGRRRFVTALRSGETYRFPAHDFAEEPDEQDAAAGSASTETKADGPTVVEQHCQHDGAVHYVRILLDAYRPILTDKQFEAAEQIILLNRTLHEVAAERGGTPEAWRQRIDGSKGCGGIKDKAPELYALWIFRNRSRHDISEVLNAIHRATHRQSSRRAAQK